MRADYLTVIGLSCHRRGTDVSKQRHLEEVLYYSDDESAANDDYDVSTDACGRSGNAALDAGK